MGLKQNWSKSDLAELRRLYPDTSNKEIADHFGVNIFLIKYKAKILKLRKSEPYILSIRKDIRKGKQPHQTKPVGSLRDNQGILQIKVRDEIGNSKKNWRSVHEMIWTNEHGPVPEGHILVFKQGMRTTVLEEIALDRLECITLKENAIRNSWINYPKELREIIHLRGVLTKTIKGRKENGTNN